MSKIILGIDPDSKAHGVAVYKDGVLIELKCLTLMEISERLGDEFYDYITTNALEFHIEDVCANNAVFRGGNGLKVQQSMARRLGMCQQAQTELERMCEFWGVKVVKHKISKVWKKDKAQFEKVTGWKGRSNEDTRSAAYFGWLGCK